MINSIKIKNVASYSAIDGVDLIGLKKVNFIYGANGCGKIPRDRLYVCKNKPLSINFL
jgi:predicted ATPase